MRKLLKEWIWPVVFVLLKAGLLVGALVAVWVASGMYHEKLYREDADAVVRVRVKVECLRPDWVRTPEDVKEFDLTERELGLLNGQAALLNRRMDDLLDKAKQVETLRKELAQGKAPPGMTGVGGPAPTSSRAAKPR